MGDRAAREQPLAGELVLRAARTLRRQMMSAIAPFELQPHQARALGVIAAEGPTGLRLGSLAERLHVAPRSVTDVVDALADLDLVERTPDPADRRAIVVRATEQGQSIGSKVTAARRAELERWSGQLSPHDSADLVRILQRLVSDAEAD